MIKKQWKPHYYKHKGPIEPDRTLLEMAVARELLTTYELSKNVTLINKHLAAIDKVYGPNAEQRVRKYMKEIKRNER